MSGTAEDSAAVPPRPRLHALRIVADDPTTLVGFYDLLLGTSTPPPGAYTEIPTDTGVHISFSRRDALADHLPPAALDASLTSGIVDIAVADVDATVERLRAAGTTVIEGPADRPWGARAATVTDPAGRIVNVFTPPAGAAS
jgi:catechol 2,3-dioxygenase-like lactoylglutathione lyase family enzyme